MKSIFEIDCNSLLSVDCVGKGEMVNQKRKVWMKVSKVKEKRVLIQRSYAENDWKVNQLVGFKKS